MLRWVYVAAVSSVLFHGLPAAAATVSGACATPSADMSADKAAQFIEKPAALLSGYTDTMTGGLAAAVRDFAAMRPETIEGMVSLSQDASPGQLRAIGAGLGTAAAACVLTQPQTAQAIQEAVLKTEKPELVTAFTSIVGDVATEAIPDLPPNGETTAGGGRGVNSSTQSGAGGTLTPPVASSLLRTLTAANRESSSALVSVSPTQ